MLIINFIDNLLNGNYLIGFSLLFFVAVDTKHIINENTKLLGDFYAMKLYTIEYNLQERFDKYIEIIGDEEDERDDEGQDEREEKVKDIFNDVQGEINVLYNELINGIMNEDSIKNFNEWKIGKLENFKTIESIGNKSVTICWISNSPYYILCLWFYDVWQLPIVDESG